MLRLLQDKELAQEVEVIKSIPDAVVDFRLSQVEQLIAGHRDEFIQQNATSWKWVYWSLPVLILGTWGYFYASFPKQEKTVPIKAETVKATIVSPQKNDVPIVLVPTEPKKITQSAPRGEKISKVEEPTSLPKPAVSSKGEETTPPVLIETKEAVPLPEQIKKVELAPQKEATVLPINPCLGIKIKAFVEETRPCSGTSEGILRVKEARGGKAPYQFSLDGKQFQEENKFEGLKENEYDIIVKDASGCEMLVYGKYSLKSKSCIQFSEYAFNPNLTTWEVPNHLEKPGELSVFDGNGRRLYMKVFDKAEKIYWGGTQNSGELLTPGIYIYHIKYSDGMIEQGKITISY
jgi:hypothetical protein